MEAKNGRLRKISEENLKNKKLLTESLFLDDGDLSPPMASCHGIGNFFLPQIHI